MKALATRTTFVIYGFKVRAVYGAIAAPSGRNLDSQELHRSMLRKSNILGRSKRASDTLQTLTRAGKLNKPRLKRLQSVLMFGDDVLRRPGDKVVVAQL